MIRVPVGIVRACARCPLCEGAPFMAAAGVLTPARR